MCDKAPSQRKVHHRQWTPRRMELQVCSRARCERRYHFKYERWRGFGMQVYRYATSLQLLQPELLTHVYRSRYNIHANPQPPGFRSMARSQLSTCVGASDFMHPSGKRRFSFCVVATPPLFHRYILRFASVGVLFGSPVLSPPSGLV
jgi:hypothetical protein